MACIAPVIALLPMLVVLGCFVFLAAHYRRSLERSMAREEQWQDNFNRVKAAFDSMEALNLKHEATIRSLIGTPANS